MLVSVDVAAKMLKCSFKMTPSQKTQERCPAPVCSPTLPSELLLFLCTVSRIRNKRCLFWTSVCVWPLDRGFAQWTDSVNMSCGDRWFKKDVNRHEIQANGQNIRESLNFYASQLNYCNSSWVLWKLHIGDKGGHKGTRCFDWNTTRFL